LPKQLEIEDISPESALTDEQLEQVYQALLVKKPRPDAQMGFPIPQAMN
jgi:hypothetical protein